MWEGRTSYLLPNESYLAKTGEDAFADAFARIECHYFVNGGWLKDDKALLAKPNIDKIRKIPGVIVNGRYDVVCPLESAWALHRAWPEAELKIAEDAGHAAHEPGILHELIEATDRFRNYK